MCGVGDEFRQVIGSGSDELGGCVLEYRSKDLLTWDFCGVLISGRALGLPGTMWECPDLFFLEDRCFLVVSLLQNKDHAGELFVGGTFDGDRFIPETNGQLDIGSQLYASQSLDAPDGRRIAFGWLRERLEELPTKYRGRVGVMSLPRKFFVGPRGQLGMAPAEELNLLRGSSLRQAPTNTDDGVLLEARQPLEALEVEIPLETSGPISIELRGADKRSVVVVAVEGETIDISSSSLNGPTANVSQTVPTGPVRFLYDGGICEIFTGTGTVRTELFYNQPPVTSVTVRRRATSPGPSQHNVRAWQLTSIWEKTPTTSTLARPAAWTEEAATPTGDL